MSNTKKIHRDGSTFKIFDKDNNEIYHEELSGFWIKKKYNTRGNITHYDDSTGYYIRRFFDNNDNLMSCESSGDKYTIDHEYLNLLTINQI
jgi:hypothetical protein